MKINYLYAVSSITYYEKTLILEGKKFKRNGHFEEIKHGIWGL